MIEHVQGRRNVSAYIGMTKQVVQSIAAFFKGEEFNVVV